MSEIETERNDFVDFCLLLQRMGFDENKVNDPDELANNEFMAQKSNSEIFVNVMTNMGWTCFTFSSEGKYIG